jgi:hypothetical protein
LLSSDGGFAWAQYFAAPLEEFDDQARPAGLGDPLASELTA